MVEPCQRFRLIPPVEGGELPTVELLLLISFDERHLVGIVSAFIVAVIESLGFSRVQAKLLIDFPNGRTQDRFVLLGAATRKRKRARADFLQTRYGFTH